jgi:hypothetical protein
VIAPCSPTSFLPNPNDVRVTAEDFESARAEALQVDRALVLRAQLDAHDSHKDPPRGLRWWTHAQLPIDPRPEPRGLSWGGTPWDLYPDDLPDAPRYTFQPSEDLRARFTERRRAHLEGHGYEGTELTQLRLRARTGEPLAIDATGIMRRIDPEYFVRGMVQLSAPLTIYTVDVPFEAREIRPPSPSGLPIRWGAPEQQFVPTMLGRILRYLFRLDLRPDLGACMHNGCTGRLVAVLSDDGQAHEADGCTECGHTVEHRPPRPPPVLGERTMFRRHFTAIAPKIPAITRESPQ